jgi:hypothetical protein
MTSQNDQRRPFGLSELAKVQLDAMCTERLERAAKNSGGPPAIRARKRAEAHDLLAMSQIASRLNVVELDLSNSLRAAIHLRGPVPCRPTPDGPLRIEYDTMLGLNYRHESFAKATPGWGFFQLLMPRRCWHANVSSDAVQALCLGLQLPAGVRVRDLVLMSFGALTMQTVQVDEYDPAGVLNKEAAIWWQANLNLVPLTDEAFVTEADLIGSEQP